MFGKNKINTNMDWGTRYERVTKAYLIKTLKIVIYEVGSVRHELYPITAAPDGLTIHFGLFTNIEIKCPKTPEPQNPWAMCWMMFV